MGKSPGSSATLQQPASVTMSDTLPQTTASSRTLKPPSTRESAKQSIEISPFPGASLKLEGLPLWANISVLVLILSALAGITLVPKLRRRFGLSGGEAKPTAFGLILIILLGVLLGIFLRQTLPPYGDQTINPRRSRNGVSQKALGNELPARVPALYSQNSDQDNSIKLQWPHDNSNKIGYRIERRPVTVDNVAFAEIAVLKSDSTSFTDSSTTPGMAYEYRVASFNGKDKRYSPSASSIAGKSTALSKPSTPVWLMVVSFIAPTVFSIIATTAALVWAKKMYKETARERERELHSFYRRFEY
jgi:hypothetical protein